MRVSCKNNANVCCLRKRALLAILVAGLSIVPGAVSAFGDPLVEIGTTQIGGAGNTADTVVRGGSTSGYGKVNYEYQMGLTEVTNAQYVMFLNAVGVTPASNALGLYSDYMANDNNGGITWNGTDNLYEVKSTGFANKPVNYVSAYDAMRFVNWLTNGASAGASTETGVYTLSGGTPIPSAPSTIVRNLAANGTALGGTGDLAGYTGTVWALPSEDEWYKAAYYNVNTGEYSLYPNGSSEDISGTEANWGNSGNGGLIAVGQLKANPNGLYDMGGNVWELTDSQIDRYAGYDIIDYAIRGAFVSLGGSFGDVVGTLESSFRYFYYADVEYSYTGFRVVSLSLSLSAVPEPEAYGVVAGLVMLAVGVWLRKGRRPPPPLRNL